MKTKNRIDIIGFVGQDPETRVVANGTPVTRFSIATTERWRDKAGALQEHTEWHRVKFWGPRAEQLAKFVRKGSLVEVEGSIRSSTWEKDGVARTTSEIHGSEYRLLDRKHADDGAQDDSANGEDLEPPAEEGLPL